MAGNSCCSLIGPVMPVENRKSLAWPGFGEPLVSLDCRRPIIFPSEPAELLVPSGVETTNVSWSFGSSDPMLVVVAMRVTETGVAAKVWLRS